ncbi:MAG: Nif3-like dinuclear metal center hexameric protein [Desulfobacterales bacterium]|nr:Nif3-like dinuclear metal center hexameric protein [Desulfobacterales bacterium]
MSARVREIMAAMEEIAPAALAESWDNVGLQIGNPDAQVSRVHVALDATPDVVEAACADGAQMVVTHHPLIFGGLKHVDFSTPMGTMISHCVTQPLSIFSAHTNLDSATGGLNDVFAEKLGLMDLKPLVPAERANHVKLVFFVPETHASAVEEALFKAGAGTLGAYSCCSFSSLGEGSYLPGDTAQPHAGHPGHRSREPELRIEVSLPEQSLGSVIKALKETHPYETVEYNVYPMVASAGSDARRVGLGRVGRFQEPMTLLQVADYLKKVMGIPHVALVGSADKIISKVALCTGSGGSLVKDFFKSGADLYISGDIKYHEARDVEAQGLALLDAGHFETEHFVCDLLTHRLKEVLDRQGHQVDVVASTVEKPAFCVV